MIHFATKNHVVVNKKEAAQGAIENAPTSFLNVKEKHLVGTREHRIGDHPVLGYLLHIRMKITCLYTLFAIGIQYTDLKTAQFCLAYDCLCTQ